MISAIIVTYNSRDHIVDCLASIEDSGAEIVVVDNASPDGTAALVSQRFPRVKLIAAGKNLGFAAAANLGARHSGGKALLLNPDAICRGPFADLEKVLESSADVAAVAPRLVDSQGRTQIGFNVRRLPTPSALIYEILLLNRFFPGNTVNRRYRCLDFDYEHPGEVEQPAGACLLVRRESFESCGGFDEGLYPLWFEDVDLCARLRDRGGKILFWPGIVFQHAGGHSVTGLNICDRQVYWYRNLLYYVKKHFPRRMGIIIRAVLLCGMALRIAAELPGLLAVSRTGLGLEENECARTGKRLNYLSWGGGRVGCIGEWDRLDRASFPGGRLDGRRRGKEHPGAVSVTIVTHNCEIFLVRCLESVLAQDWPSVKIIVVDNDSRDGTRSILARYQDRVKVVLNSENRGFAAGQNQAIREASGEWILALNPDVMLAPNFISCLVRGADLDPAIGMICGKLLRATPTLGIPANRNIDSAGIYFTPTFRHLDRGSNLPDGEDYDRPCFVFGATAAAALYRKSMIEDVSVGGEFFDEDFFIYREDADVSWRSQLLGWRCLYLPDAVGYHVRRVFPGSRRTLPALINRQSVQNRFLMRIKNAGGALYARNFLAVTIWDAGVVLYCLFLERSSLSAFRSVFRLWRRTIAKRHIIQERRRVSDAYIQSWFRFRPATLPTDILPHATSDIRSAAEAASATSLPAAGAGSARLRS